MGGNALKEHGARRVTAAEAKEVSAKVCAAIDEIFLEHGFDHKSHMVEAYREKADYGDLDIVVLDEAMRSIGLPEVAAALEQKLGVSMPYYHHNPNATNISVGFPLEEGILQIDLMFAEAKSFEFSRRYWAWNDLGNLITIVAKRMDKLMFGQSGLSSIFKEGGHLLGKVTFTHDFDAALEFLGYDSERHRRGFDTLEEIYEFAASSPYYNSDLYLLENQNHVARTRNRKRSTYSGFLKWAEQADVPQYEWPKHGKWVEKALAAFPHASVQLHQLSEQERKRREVRKVFNGLMVATLTGLQGEKLGLFMEAFKKFSGEATFFDFILDQPRDELDRKILSFHEMYKDFPKPDAFFEPNPVEPSM